MEHKAAEHLPPRGRVRALLRKTSALADDAALPGPAIEGAGAIMMRTAGGGKVVAGLIDGTNAPPPGTVDLLSRLRVKWHDAWSTFARMSASTSSGSDAMMLAGSIARTAPGGRGPGPGAGTSPLLSVPVSMLSQREYSTILTSIKAAPSRDSLL